MMKRMSAFLLCAALLCSLAACGTPAGSSVSGSSSVSSSSTASSSDLSESGSTDGSAPVSEPPADSPQEPPAASEAAESGKVLVVYYSATGSTEAVAETIASELNGDLFALEPTEPYTSGDLNWTDQSSRVSREHDDESLRDVPLTEAVPANWDSYDTVFVGYPIWWGIAAWPVNGFIATNDFTGKTVIPFCTSSSSGLGESGNLLADAAGTGAWQEGMRFNSRPSEDAVREWARGLALPAAEAAA